MLEIHTLYADLGRSRLGRPPQAVETSPVLLHLQGSCRDGPACKDGISDSEVQIAIERKGCY